MEIFPVPVFNVCVDVLIDGSNQFWYRSAWGSQVYAEPRPEAFTSFRVFNAIFATSQFLQASSLSFSVASMSSLRSVFIMNPPPPSVAAWDGRW